MSFKKLTYKILRYSGIPFLFREVFQRNRVSIVMFHDIGPREAEGAFAYLAARYNIISLERYMEARENGAKLPPKSLIITLDDGYARNYQLLPVVKKLNIPITIFLCSGLLDTNRHFWFLFKQRNMGQIPLRNMPNSERLAVLESFGFRQDREFDRPQSLSREQIMEMREVINLQAHTQFHPFLTSCEDEEAWEEIAGSKRDLEEEYGLEINTLAFPHGNYSERDLDILKQAGFQYAITVDYGFNTLQTDPFRLKRLSIDDSGDIDLLSLKASGVWTFFRVLSGVQQKTGIVKVGSYISQYLIFNTFLEGELDPIIYSLG
ncbi:MAG: polysaccharide deacetylase family protein [Saprospirales bacterium]|nr:polysaccharide deacetylase family protein [Saprospirales bacterium]